MVLAFDTSNYTTSVAVFDGEKGENLGKLLKVPSGKLGLRQSEALFQHVKQLPELMEELQVWRGRGTLQGVGASTRPRDQEKSYMPCFLAGASQGRVVASTLGLPFCPFSHQQGHLAAAAWSAKGIELLDHPFLAWHLSGGTTELLLAEPEPEGLQVRSLGGTTDLAAGQLLDRTGLLLGLDFPGGQGVDALAQGRTEAFYPLKRRGLSFSLSGIENQVKDLVARGEEAPQVAGFVLETLSQLILQVTEEAQRRYPGLPVLCSGGVASSRRLSALMRERTGALFATPQYAKDNAMGIALLTWRSLQRKGGFH